MPENTRSHTQSKEAILSMSPMKQKLAFRLEIPSRDCGHVVKTQLRSRESKLH